MLRHLIALRRLGRTVKFEGSFRCTAPLKTETDEVHWARGRSEDQLGLTRMDPRLRVRNLIEPVQGDRCRRGVADQRRAESLAVSPDPYSSRYSIPRGFPKASQARQPRT
jgi:hypothetical protein